MLIKRVTNEITEMSSETLIFNTFRSILTIVRVEKRLFVRYWNNGKVKVVSWTDDRFLNNNNISLYFVNNIIELKNIDISIRNLFDFYFTYY